jgi:hypothetical protein
VRGAGVARGAHTRQSRRSIPRHVEQTARQHRAAEENWGRLDAPAQEALLAELVHTRSEDLRRAYPDMLAIGYGRRTRKMRGNKRRRDAELAVKFMIKKKWAKGSRLSKSSRAIPNGLLAYWDTPRGRLLMKVPTDIDELSFYRECRAQGRRWVVASNANSTISESGTIACVVRIPGDTRSVYALCAAHVFDLTKHYWPNLPSNVGLSDSASSTAIGRVSDFAGSMQPASKGLSFDAALAKVSNTGALKANLGASLPSTAIKTAADIPSSYKIATVHGLLNATKGTVWTNQPLDYALSSGDTLTVQHQTLVESDADTAEGDSGSPAVSNDGSTLVGMNIYGGEGVSFIIPAYTLLATQNYSGLPPGQLLSLVTDL